MEMISSMDNRFRFQIKASLKKRFAWLLYSLLIAFGVALLIVGIIRLVAPDEIENQLAVTSMISVVIGMMVVCVTMMIQEGLYNQAAYGRHLVFQGTRKSLLQVTMISRAISGVATSLVVVIMASLLSPLGRIVAPYDEELGMLQNAVLTPGIVLACFLSVFFLLSVGGLMASLSIINPKVFLVFWLGFIACQLLVTTKIPRPDGSTDIALTIMMKFFFMNLGAPIILIPLAILLALTMTAECVLMRRMSLTQ